MEQDEALEQKWAAREGARRKDLAQAQTDYGRVRAVPKAHEADGVFAM